MEPKLLCTLSGEKVTDKETWEKFRRGECFDLLAKYVYGIVPKGLPKKLDFSVECAERELCSILFKKITMNVDGYCIPLRIFYKKSDKPLPTVVYVMHTAQETSTDIENEPNNLYIPIEDIVNRGYAVCVFYFRDVYQDILSQVDYEHSLFKVYSRPRSERDGDEWASVSLWAYVASRVFDYLETDPIFDKSNVCIAGHSRGGKTALWTGASDKRYSFVVSNSSGCMGAAMLRGKLGEHIKFITDNTDWFATNLSKYAEENEEKLPVDQHMLLALIAPRLLYVKSDVLDEWSDPAAERRSARLASSVYELYGERGAVLPDESEIEVARSYHDGRIGYHVSEGDHKIRREDWEKFLAFWEKHRG